MRRLFWFGAGVAAGVAVTRKVNATTRKATPAGVAEQLGGAVRDLADAVGAFGADVRAGMREREQELDEAAQDGRVAETARAAAAVSGSRTAETSGAGAAADASQRRARRAGR
ncbi:hypothetical protein [Salinifilum ghardaiensis]